MLELSVLRYAALLSAEAIIKPKIVTVLRSQACSTASKEVCFV